MPESSSIIDWFQLGKTNYKKFDLLTPDWPSDVYLSHLNVVAAPFGGPIAVRREPHIRIFNTVGVEMGKILWNHDKLITMGWSDTEELMCVRNDAVIFHYDIFGNEKRSYRMCKDAHITKIVDAKIYQSYSGTGVAVLTTNGCIYIKNTEDSHAIMLPEIPKSLTGCSCWTIATEGRNSYCLVGRETEVFKLVPGEAVSSKPILTDFSKEYNRFLHMAVCYHNKNIALYTNTGLLCLASLDMSQKYCEFDTARGDVPIQLSWITNSDDNESDAVAIVYPTFLLLVNKQGQTSHIYDSVVYLTIEIDGVRIFTNSTHEMIQKVPSSVQKVFAINMLDPSAYLHSAYKKFQENSYKSDEYLSHCRTKLNIAVDGCIEAATHEFDPKIQKNLMKAAYFGKSFIPYHNPDIYMRSMRILRVLNTLRHPKIAIPLTYNQFMHLEANVVMGRLVYRKHYAVALQVAKHLELSQSWIFEHWAYDKILNVKDDIEVARKITERFKNPSVEGISFCNIAEKAHLAKRNNLAIKLLDLEPRVSLKVPLLLKLGKYNHALQSATQSGDTELVLSVLLEIKKKTMVSTFHMIVREYAMAKNLYKKINSYKDNALIDVHTLDDDHKSIAVDKFRYAIDHNTLESELIEISDIYSKGRLNVESELCSDTRKILKLQEVLTKKLESIHNRVDLRGLTIHDTMLKLLQLGELKEAEKIKNDFKVPDKRFWWLRIRTMAEKYKWDDLEKFAKNRKSPIGYEPFVEICLQYNNLTEAQKYITKCPDDRKAYLFLRAELLDKSADSAFAQRDESILMVLKQKATSSKDQKLLDKVNDYLTRI